MVSKMEETMLKIKSKVIAENDSFRHKIYHLSDYNVDNDQEDPIHDFTLDDFQKSSIKSIYKDENVLVSAHTSSGKTLVAQKGIEFGLKNNKRIVYTAPIKALSNQKFEEFKKVFGDQTVGLVTGDYTHNEEAKCLIMTTEILLNRIRIDPSFFDKVQCVIFDEAHYIGDKDRGTVWEQCIILLPKTTQMIFLSASIPNTEEFASWIVASKESVCNVVETFKRPVPLRSFVNVYGSLKIKEVTKEDGSLARQSLCKYFAESRSLLNIDMKNCVLNVLNYLRQEDRLPCCVFSFSRKKCDDMAKEVKMDFLPPGANLKILQIFNAAFKNMNGYPPEIANALPMLQRGIAVHHSGVHPRLKELVEILLSNNLIMVLFSTETISVGLNVPIRSVIFTEIVKFDGGKKRYITNSEYLQMRGRAGRRGIDQYGYVYIMVHKKVWFEGLCNLLAAKPEPLQSQFHFAPNVILNCINREEITVESLAIISFLHFNYIFRKSIFERTTFDLNEKTIFDDLFDVERRLHHLKEEYRIAFSKDANYKEFIVQGKVIGVRNEDFRLGPGIIINSEKVLRPENDGTFDLAIIVLMKASIKALPLSLDIEDMHPIAPDQPWYPAIVCIKLENVYKFYAPYLTLHSKEVQYKKNVPIDPNAKKILNYLNELSGRHRLGEIDAYHFAVFDDEHNKKLFNDIDATKRDLENQLSACSLDYANRRKRYENFLSLKHEMESSKDCYDDEQRKIADQIQMLKNLNYIKNDDAMDIKGRVCKSINHPLSVMITELCFEGFWNEKSLPNIAAILSCFLCTESSKPPKIDKFLSEFYDKLKEMHITVFGSDVKIAVKPNFMKLVYALFDGTCFDNLDFGEIYAGSLIYCIKQLRQLLQCLCNINDLKQLDSMTALENLLAKVENVTTSFGGSLYTD